MPALLAAILAIGTAGAAPHAASRPARSTDHPRPALFEFKEGGTTGPVQTPREWRRKREQILAAMQEVMGPLPPRPAEPVEAEVIEQVAQQGLRRIRLDLRIAPGERVPAYLLIPDTLAPGHRAPAMLALHQTVAIGKAEPVGMGNKPNLRYGLELARRGYIVLAPDYPSFGDYSHDFSKSRFVSGTVKGILNHMRCVDYLCSRGDVDPRRIGVIGHSLGGHNAIFVAAFDERLKVIVSSCGWTRFHTYYGGNLAGWTSDRYMPRIREVYGNDPDRLPIEFDDLIAALAPRAFYSCSPIGDENFDVEGVRSAARSAARVYALFGAPDRLVVRHPDCGHDFTPDSRREAYRFIDKALGHKPATQPMQVGVTRD